MTCQVCASLSGVEITESSSHTSNGLTLTIDLECTDVPAGTNIDITWGDGVTETVSSSLSSVSHTYGVQGVYNVSLSSECVDGGSCPDLSNILADASFDPSTSLPTAQMRQLHTDWWSMYDAPLEKGGVTYTRYANLYSDPMEEMLELPLEEPDSNGSYSIARAWAMGLYSLVETLRMTGDPDVLDEIVWWSQQVRNHVGDWDGRGYEYIRYGNPSGVNERHHDSDTNWLDECMMGGVLALLAYAMHQNRAGNPACVTESDYWLTYLDENFVPKWLYRTHYNAVGTRSAYTPPASLGLQNAIGWTTTHAPGEDEQLWANPGQNQWGPHPMLHPVRQFAHPAIMNAGMHYILGKTFSELGRTPKGNWSLTAAEYTQQAVDVAAWFLDQSTLGGDGTRTWWLTMNGVTPPGSAHQAEGTSGLRTEGYSLYCNYWIHFFHLEGFEHFASASRMAEYTKQWIGGSNSVYTPGNYTNMKKYSDGTGSNVGYRLRSSAILAAYDSTGYLEQAASDVVSSPTNHLIYGGGGVDGLHYNGSMHMALIDAQDSGLCAGEVTDQSTLGFTVQIQQGGLNPVGIVDQRPTQVSIA